MDIVQGLRQVRVRVGRCRHLEHHPLWGKGELVDVVQELRRDLDVCRALTYQFLEPDLGQSADHHARDRGLRSLQLARRGERPVAQRIAHDRLTTVQYRLPRKHDRIDRVPRMPFIAGELVSHSECGIGPCAGVLEHR